MARTGASRGRVKFGGPFFRWLQDQILMVEDYAYAGTNFTEDPDLPLPPGGHIRGNLGSKMGLIRNRAKISFCELEFKNQ